MQIDWRETVRGTAYDVRDDGVADYITESGQQARVQDVTEILKLNAERRNEDRFKGFRTAPTYRRVASIPVAAVDIAMSHGLDILHNADDMKAFLNDRNNLMFRTTTEKV